MNESGQKTIDIITADLERPDHCRAVLELTEAYARDPMGIADDLPDGTAHRLIDGLRAHPTTLIFLAYAGSEPVGIATCFIGFSTFAARRLINVHDLAVLPGHRGSGVGRRLLEAVLEKGRHLDCCKVTLEVQENNRRARALYEASGFAQAHYADGAGGALFYSKPL